MCADQYFVKQSYYHDKKVVYVDFISGKFNNTGYSSTNIYNTLMNYF